jgi:hypothetical protein
MSYFRRIIDNEEVSERAFKITQLAIEISGSFYQAWHYRRHLFEKLQKDVNDELVFVTKVGLDNPKNYQMWSYRRELLALTNDYNRELQFLDTILQLDERNVHAWGFRLWVAERFNIFGTQFEFVESYIRANPRNNSAWHFRSILISKLCVSKIDDLIFVLCFVDDLLNDSCFEYLKSVCELENCSEIKRKLVQVVKNEGICVGIIKVLEKIFGLEEKNKLVIWCFGKLMEIDEVRKEYWSDRMEKVKINEKELDEADKEFCEYFFIS